MAFTKSTARVMADFLSDAARDALLRLSGRKPVEGEITEDTISELEGLELARRDTNMVGDNELLLLITSRGKKVAAEI